MLRFPKGKRIGIIIFSVVALLSIGLITFYLVNGNSFDMRSSAGNSAWAVGDLNADQKVTMADFNIWLTGYRKNKKDGAYDAIPDLNKDKKVSFSDFFLWLNAYREYKNSSSETMKAISKTGDMGTFKLEYQYIGDNTWFYKVTGTFAKAKSCDTGSVNIGITKNKNAVDIVNVYMNGTTFSEEPAICTGSYTKEGEITASPNANIVFALRDLGSASVASFKAVDVNYAPMTLTYEYKGDNTWSYAIDGDLPSGCFSASSSISVASSSVGNLDPNDTVYVFTYISPGRLKGACAASIVKYSKTGTFKALPSAKIGFVTSPTYPEVGLLTDLVPVITTRFTYQGSNLWYYLVTGTLPSGCYSASTIVSPAYASTIYSDPVPVDKCRGAEGYKCVGNAIGIPINSPPMNGKLVTLWTVVSRKDSSTSSACSMATKAYSAEGKLNALETATMNSYLLSPILK